MKRLLSFLLLAGLLGGLRVAAADATPAPALSVIELKNGQEVPANGLSRNEDQLMVSVTTSSGGTGQVAYGVADVAGLKLATPPEMDAASAAIAAGHPDEALAQILPVVAAQQQLRDIPGNLWAKAALIQSSALAALKRTGEAESLLKEIMSSSSDSEVQVAAKLQMALVSPPKDPAEALAAYDTIIGQSTDPGTLTHALLAEGDLRFSQHEFVDALMNYLTVLVFYPDQDTVIPKALWGAARSYGKLKDPANQEKAWKELMTHYPKTPEASLAQAESLRKKNYP